MSVKVLVDGLLQHMKTLTMIFPIHTSTILTLGRNHTPNPIACSTSTAAPE